MSVFPGNKSVIAMAQPQALPGSFKNTMSIDDISNQLLEEIRILERNKVDGVILQNFHDGPVKQNAQMQACSYMTRLSCDIKHEFPNLILGILVCWDGPMSVMVADAVNADFVRIEHLFCGAEMTTAGIIQGQCVEIQQTRKLLGSRIPVYADIYEPHSIPICQTSLETAAYDAVKGAFADGLFLCGKTLEQTLDYVRRVKSKLPNIPIICGGGSNADNVKDILTEYDGVCVGSWIKDGSLSNPINEKRLKLYMDKVNEIREKQKV